MPHYFFHVLEDREISDDHGMHLPDEAAAKLHGVAMLGKVLREDPNALLAAGEIRLTATAADGAVLFTINTRIHRG